VKAVLDRTIIGQEGAKTALAAAVRMHTARMAGHNVPRPVCLLVGPTGSGKTAIARALQAAIEETTGERPGFTEVNLAQTTPAAYRGGGLEEALVRLVNASGDDAAQVARSIVLFDEVDKIRSAPYNGLDLGIGLQAELLKIIEGTQMDVQVSSGKTATIDTRSMFPILAGAFTELTQDQPSAPDPLTVGFCRGKGASQSAASDTDTARAIGTEQLVRYGFLPEFVGRITSITTMERVSVDAMVRLLSDSNSVLGQYRRLLELDGVNLAFEHAALRRIAEQAFALSILWTAVRSSGVRLSLA